MKRLMATLSLLAIAIPQGCDNPVLEPAPEAVSPEPPGFSIDPVVNDWEMVFTSNRSGNLEIWYKHVTPLPTSTVTLTNLSNSPGSIDQGADWSPAGDSIVFSSNRGKTGQGLGGTDLWIMGVAADGTPLGSPYRVASTAGSDLLADWSPDGNKIVWKCGLTICYIERNNKGVWKNVKYLTTKGKNDKSFDADPSWSPSSDRVIFQRICAHKTCADRNARDLYTVDLATGRERNTTSAIDLYVGSPSWGASKQIVFTVTHEDNTKDIYLGELSGNTLINVSPVTSSGHAAYPWWTPDKDQITYVVDNEAEVLLVDPTKSSAATYVLTGTTPPSMNLWGRIRR